MKTNNTFEIWKPVTIEGYETVYEVSNTGKVRRTSTLCELTPLKVGCGYLDVILQNKGNRKQIKIHRLVALAFIDNPENLPYVNHIDENKHNNTVTNLEWCSASQNVNHGTLIERMLKSRKLHKDMNVGMYQNGELIDSTPTIKEMALKHGLNYHMVAQCTAGDTKTYKGYTFKYIDNVEGN